MDKFLSPLVENKRQCRKLVIVRSISRTEKGKRELRISVVAFADIHLEIGQCRCQIIFINIAFSSVQQNFFTAKRRKNCIVQSDVGSKACALKQKLKLPLRYSI